MPVTNADFPQLFRWQFYLLFLVCQFVAMPALATRVVESVPVAMITYDDEGKPLDYPSAVFFDPQRDELYVVNGGTGRVVVYGPDYFPRWSIGSGRGLLSPGSGTVLPDGRVFTVQQRNRHNPTAKITQLSGAFFPEQDIPLEDIPGIEGFVPRNIALSADGLMYVAGDLYRGILVLDDEGFFLRKLQPMDQLEMLSQEYEPEKESSEDEGKAPAEVVEEEEFADIPEEFRPRKTRVSRGESSKKTSEGPVKINYVAIDGEGRIYMLSPETGRIYVHDSEERFLFSFGTKGGSPGQMSNPRAMVIDEKRELIYIADYMRHTILAYNKAGEHIFETGGRGFSPGWFNYPNDLSLTSRGELIVADLFNRRVQILDIGYEDSFFNLEGLLGSEVETDDAETSQQLVDDVSELETEAFDLVPGAPDIDYAEEQRAPTTMEDGAEEEDESELMETIEIEILQSPEIPTISE